MSKTIDWSYNLLLKSPREHLSGIITGIWLSVATNVIVNGAMNSSKSEFLIPGVLGLIGCILWNYFTICGQELMREMDGKRSIGLSSSDIESDTKDSLVASGNAWRILASYIASIVIAVVSVGWLVILVLNP